MNCGNCNFYKPKDGNVGKCRRFPPKQEGKGAWKVDIQPTVKVDDWCGEHKKAKKGSEK